jgi:predicted phosphoadenosine phosphosulfate sulfurtransferase
MPKQYQETNVLQAAKQRIKQSILNYPDYYVSFSGGKDSGVLVELIIEVATEIDRLPVKVVFSDLEAIYKRTETYCKYIMEKDEVEPYWLCFEEIDQNASSIYERFFKIWDKSCKDKWVRPMPSMDYVINDDNCPDALKKYLNPSDLSEWSIEWFGEYLCDKLGIDKICNFIGMRAQESYGRYMAVKTSKNRIKDNGFTYLTKNGATRTWTSLPIYDWQFSDVWKFYADTGHVYNKVYDDFFRIGIPYANMRTCAAFGEEQKSSLWQWSQIEPESWDRLLQRVEGIGFGGRYNHTNINRGKVTKPSSITWKEYLDILMGSLPPLAYANYKEKFDITFNYHKVMYEDKLGISKDVYIQDSRKDAKNMSEKIGLSIKHFISYETLCGAIIKRDFVFKKYGFGFSNKMLERIKNVYKNGVED